MYTFIKAIFKTKIWIYIIVAMTCILSPIFLLAILNLGGSYGLVNDMNNLMKDKNITPRDVNCHMFEDTRKGGCGMSLSDEDVVKLKAKIPLMELPPYQLARNTKTVFASKFDDHEILHTPPYSHLEEDYINGGKIRCFASFYDPKSGSLHIKETQNKFYYIILYYDPSNHKAFIETEY